MLMGQVGEIPLRKRSSIIIIYVDTITQIFFKKRNKYGLFNVKETYKPIYLKWNNL